MGKIKIPKSSRFRKILTISILEIAAIIVAVCCVIAYMTHNGISKGRWAFFIFVCVLAFSFAVSVPIIFVRRIPRIYTTWNWNIMLSSISVILSLLLLTASIVISVHITGGCRDFCALVTVAAVIAFFLTFLYLYESLVLFKRAVKEEKTRQETSIVNNMETQHDTQTSTSQL